MSVDDESTLVVIAYPNDSVAQGAIATLERLSIEQFIDLEDTAYAVKDRNGAVRFRETRGAAAGAPRGGMRARLGHLPFLGSSVPSGAVGEHFTHLGIDDAYMEQLAGTLPPEGAAVFMLVRSSARDRVLEEMSAFRGTVIKTSLPSETEEQLKAALAGEDTEPPAQ